MIPLRELKKDKIRLEGKMARLVKSMNLSYELVCNDRGTRLRRDQECMNILCDRHEQVCAQITEWKRGKVRYYWNPMRSIDDTLVYLNRLGFAGHSRSIVIKQERLVAVETALADVWGYPFWVHYSRKHRDFAVKDSRGCIDVVAVNG